MVKHVKVRSWKIGPKGLTPKLPGNTSTWVNFPTKITLLPTPPEDALPHEFCMIFSSLNPPLCFHCSCDTDSHSALGFEGFKLGRWHFTPQTSRHASPSPCWVMTQAEMVIGINIAQYHSSTSEWWGSDRTLRHYIYMYIYNYMP